MKKYLFPLLFLCNLSFANSPPLSFDFAGVSLITFTQATFKEILGRDYVIAPDVLAMDRKITISVKTMDVSAVSDFVQNILGAQGITVTERSGIYYLDQYVDPVVKDVVPATSQSLLAGDSLQRPLAHSVVPSAAASALASPDAVKLDSESRLYIPVNRPADFMVAIINAGFGGKCADLVGGRVLVTAQKSKLDKIFALIAQLDFVPKSVEISASWIEITQTSGAGQGIALAASLLGAKFGASLGTVNSGSALSLTGSNFQLVIDALNTDSRFKQVSSSRMVGDEYEKISLTVGDETPTVSSTSKDNAGNPVQNIVYRPSGVIVDVLPKVLGSGKINMSIDGQISSFQATVTGVNGSPTLIKRQVKSVVTVEDGEVLLIGGLNDSQSTKATSGLAFLPASWSFKSDTKIQTDLVLVLSAKVANLAQ